MLDAHMEGIDIVLKGYRYTTDLILFNCGISITIKIEGYVFQLRSG